jgi:hypothetical protein
LFAQLQEDAGSPTTQAIAMTKPTEKDQARNPRDFDKGTGDQVEKKPKETESPQQNHDDEDHG